MAINPMALMQLTSRFSIFNEQHPKVPMFLKAVSQDAVKVGSIIEIKVTSPDGDEYVTNIKVTPEDMETIRVIRGLKDTSM
ncbi:MAG: hypothetical protein K6E28_06975 [Eubacterium sp.]|nr:hypothetical protein [Eubacterium sp.]